MIINNNIGAMNAYRQMGANQNAMGNSMEKLSSGLRINRAGDDAAGLAISEKMRGQIRGLEQAERNSQDGISLIQTAEGALNETHSILQRIRELAVQSGNDTNTNEDRKSIQDEVKQLQDEIDRIGNTTEFNTKKLINGDLEATKVAGFENAAVMSETLGKETAASVSKTLGDSSAFTGGEQSITVDGAKIKFNTSEEAYQNANGDIEAFSSLLEEDINKAINEYNSSNNTKIDKITVSEDPETANNLMIKSGSVGTTSTIMVNSLGTGDGNLWEISGFGTDSTTEVEGSEGVIDAAGGGSLEALKSLAGDTDQAVFTFEVDGKSIAVDLNDESTSGFASKNVSEDTDLSAAAAGLQVDLNKAIEKYNETVPISEKVEDVKVNVKDGALVVESGSSEAKSSIKFDNSEASQLLGLAQQSSAQTGGGVKFQIGANETQTLQVNISDMRSEGLDIENIDLSTQEGSEKAITIINDAITKVSSQRSSLGAVQNRLEHTINNLGTSAENLQSAESRIRDVDMAKEMMEMTKNNILSQASQSMLAQANQQPQSVLQLLQ